MVFENLKIAHLAAIVTGGLMLCAASAANAVPFFFAGAGLDPIDPTVGPPGTTVSIVVPSPTGFPGNSILDLNVSIELTDSPGAPPGGVTPWDDLTMVIEHDGTSVVLNDNASCCTFGIFDVTFDDEAIANISSAVGGANAIGPFRPDDAVGDLLSAFDGHSILGTWNLTFTEFCCSAETRLVGWSISGEVGEVPEPGTLALFGLGLAGLGFARRKRMI